MFEGGGHVMSRSRWLLYGGLLGLFFWLSPNMETTTLPQGKEVTFRVGVYSWFRYYSREEKWSEGGQDYRREESGSHLSLVNPSILAGVVGIGLLVAYGRRSRSARRAEAYGVAEAIVVDPDVATDRGQHQS
jgi:hypothetical protein